MSHVRYKLKRTLLDKQNSPHMFDEIAPTYDWINQILSLGLHHHWRAFVAKSLPKKPHLSLLDCATGTGDQLLYCLKKRPDIASAVGIDLAENMLRYAEKKAAKTSYNYRIRLQKASVLDIPYANDCFDCATISFGIRNLPSLQKGLTEILRILKPGGTLIILEFSLPTIKWLSSLHLFYLRHFVPLIGKWLSGHKKAYSYLNTTIESFPYGQALCDEMQRAGLINAVCTPLSLGIASMYTAKKPV